MLDMKNIRKFETVADYEAWMSGDAVFPNMCYVAEDGRIAYNPPPPPPLYIEAIENLTVTFYNSYEYSKDNSTWTSATSSTRISANAGERVYFRASLLGGNAYNGMGFFSVSDGICNVGGNVMSMIYGADYEGKVEITQNYQFSNLFKGCKSSLVDASALRLPATTLAHSCYSGMFMGCTSLVNAPELPATALAEYCYSDMFRDCTSLAKAPELPATTLVDYCYYYMFKGCSSLAYIKAMFTSSPSTYTTRYWVDGVSPTGTFVKNSAAAWGDIFGADAIPNGWTVETADA